MSGTPWLTLDRTAAGAGAIDPAATYDGLVAEIAAGLGAAHATVLAKPAPSGTAIVWMAAGSEARRLSELPPESRRALLAALASILSDLRRLAEAGRSPALAAAWPALRQVPSLAQIFAVDGRPVLTAWGQGTADPLAGYDDGRPWVPPPTLRWQPYAAAAAASALFAGLAILALPQLARWAVPAPAMCEVVPAERDLMRRTADAESRGNELRALLAATNDEIGRKQLMCPLPVAAAPQPPPAVPRPPEPPPRAELPADRWNEHDLSMLEGCWHNITQMTTTMMDTGQVIPVQEWRLCFDRSGRGQQIIRWADSLQCVGNQSASFRDDDTLALTDTNRCRGQSRYLYQGTITCKRISDTEATCVRRQTEGPGAGSTQSGRFTR